MQLWQECEHIAPDTKVWNAAQRGIPSVQTLFKSVEDAQIAWDAEKKGRFGRSKELFFKFMETMDDHAFLFKFIPTGDKYVSLISGVVSSMVKVRLYCSTQGSMLLNPSEVGVVASEC